MKNWKNYAGSVLLAGLLLQGCSNTTDDSTPATKADTTVADNGIKYTDGDVQKELAKIYNSSALSDAEKEKALSDFKVKIINLLNMNTEDESIVALQDAVNTLIDDKTNDINTLADAADAIVAEYTQANASARRASLKDLLINIMDTGAGGAVSGAAFDVVLNSEGVTVVMLDAARGSRTVSQIMIDAIGRNPQLLVKMCPMLQTNAEFGEKFAALAYEMYPETKEGAPDMGNFFFSIVDAPMYGCLTDAMLLSNEDYAEPKQYTVGEVAHSTNAYMGLLMARYAKDFFIQPGTGVTPIAGWGTTDAFSSLMFDTGANADFNATSTTFTNHGDANELANEQLFYSLFKTPGTTASFIVAMQQLDKDTQKLFMDKIFLGQGVLVEDENGTHISTENPDTVQAALNIISIGSAMYDGIYGEKNEEGLRVNPYGFDAYMSSFIDFALLIPGDRYFAYSSAFVNAGYEFAAYNGIDLWENAQTGAQDLWDGYFAENNTSTETNASAAPARSAMNGTDLGNWLADISDLFSTAISNALATEETNSVEDNRSYWEQFTDATISAYDWTFDENQTILGAISDTYNSATDAVRVRTNIAIDTLIDGRDDQNNTVYFTTVQAGVENGDNKVAGLHGLVELAIREDMVNDQHAEGNESYTLDNADFVLPPFAESLTWSYTYTSATDRAAAYYGSTKFAMYIDDFRENDLVNTQLVQDYFYPNANNSYIPNSLLAVDWLRLPENYADANISATDFNFDGGYLDIYLVSKNDALSEDVDLERAVGTEVVKVDMGTDSLIAVDENGQTLDGLYVYKIRVVTPEQTASVFDALAAWGDNLLDMVGLKSDNATQTVPAEDNNAS